HLTEAHPNGRRPGGHRVRRVPDQVDQQIIQSIGITFEKDDVDRGIELQGDLLLLEHAAFERAAGADDAHGVEPLRAREGAAGRVRTGATTQGPSVAERDPTQRLPCTMAMFQRRRVASTSSLEAWWVGVGSLEA